MRDTVESLGLPALLKIDFSNTAEVCHLVRERYERLYGTRDKRVHRRIHWLFVTMPGYAGRSTGSEFEALACDVKWRSGNLRPLVVPHRCDYRLYTDFAKGISWHRAIELAQLAMHGEEQPDAGAP